MRRRLDLWTFGLAAPHFIAVSEAVVDDYREQVDYRVSKVVPNPIDPKWLSGPSLTRHDARVALGLSETTMVIFAAGHLHRQKGFDTLAAAAKLLTGVEFVVAGAGPERRDLENIGTLRLIGVQPQDVIRRWIAAADVVAVPSRYESFGIFAAEAMASGRALVAADIPGLRTTVEGAAILVKADDPTALAEAIGDLLANEDRRRALEAHGPALAARFTPRAWAKRVSEIYWEALQPSAATVP